VPTIPIRFFSQSSFFSSVSVSFWYITDELIVDDSGYVIASNFLCLPAFQHHCPLSTTTIFSFHYIK
jgi:hypothetical protein